MENRIERYRKPLGLSQYRLGKRVGMSRISINHIESGKVMPNLRTANDIARALGVSLYQIFDLDGTGRYEYHHVEAPKDTSELAVRYAAKAAAEAEAQAGGIDKE